MKEVLYNASFISRIIPIVNIRTIFGHTTNSDIFLTFFGLSSFSDIQRTRTDFFLKLAPLVRTLPTPQFK